MRHVSLFALLMLMSLLAGCDTNLINDPSFDRWCGEQLCDWSTDSGEIKRVGTWHEKDYGVSLETPKTRISQLSTQPGSGPCIRFDLIADVDLEAQVLFTVDFGDDGSIDFMESVPTARWETNSFVINVPHSYSKVRYAFEKPGTGTAVLAQIWADLASGCSNDSDAGS